MNHMATLLTILGLSTSTEVSVKTVAQVKMRILNKLILHAKINQKKISRMTEYEYLRHNLIDNTVTVLNDDIELHDEN